MPFNNKKIDLLDANSFVKKTQNENIIKNVLTVTGVAAVATVGLFVGKEMGTTIVKFPFPDGTII